MLNCLTSNQQVHIQTSSQLSLEAVNRLESKGSAHLEQLRIDTLDILRELERSYDLHTTSLAQQIDNDKDRAMRWDALMSKIDDLAAVSGRISIEYRILESLCYRNMNDRVENVAKAHSETFEWIFDKPSSNTYSPTSSTFPDWLKRHEGLYWITGKAGSGKSTLMKFLINHRRTKEALIEWKGDKELIVASFFFWYHGTKLQKSQTGLLQSLLYEILHQYPDLIPVVLPRRWEIGITTQSVLSQWDRSGLFEAFTKLSQQTATSKRFCIFIDGLDEYEGDHQELLSLIQGFASSDHFKFCVSSRPWNVFQVTLGADYRHTIQLEDLTRGDIKHYVHDTLVGNHLFVSLEAQELQHCNNLISEIVDKAQGVFLWVYLVVRSLREGLMNADRVIDLQRRLRALPSDLENYFRHMLKSIDDIYGDQTARTFSTAVKALEPLTLMTYAMLDEIEENPTHALDLEMQAMSAAEIESLHEKMRLRINARCKDLLVVHENSKEIVSVHSSRLYHPFFEYKVEFLHRTVRDFFQVEDVQAKIFGRNMESFNVNESLCQAFLAQIKTIPIEYEARKGCVLELLEDMTHYAASSQWQSGSPPTALLDELSRTMKLFYPKFDDQSWYYEDIDPRFRLMRESFLDFAAQSDLGLYVQEKLITDPCVTVNISTLLGIFQPLPPIYMRRYTYKTCADEELIYLIARHYLDENTFIFEERESKWSTCVALVKDDWASSTYEQRVGHIRMLSVLAEEGADPGRDEDALRWVDFVLTEPKGWWEINGLPSQDFYMLLQQLLPKFVELAFTYSTRLSHNQIYKGSTLWSLLMRALHDYAEHSFGLKLEQTVVSKIVKCFLRSGASLQDTNWAAAGDAPTAKDVIGNCIRPDCKVMEELEEEERLVQKKSSIISLGWWGWKAYLST